MRNRSRVGGELQGGLDSIGGTLGLNLGPENIIKCPKCSSPLCIQSFMLFKISALQSPTGQPGILPNPAGFICLQCGRPFQPEDIEQKSGLLSGETSEEDNDNSSPDEGNSSNLVTLK